MEFPFPPSTFEGKNRQAEIGAAFEWIKQGWYIFLSKSGLWLSSSFILIFLLFIIALIPVFGIFLCCFCVPIFSVGLFKICATISKDDNDETIYNFNELSILDLFVGFDFYSDSNGEKNEKNKQLFLLSVAFVISIFLLIMSSLFILQSGIVVENTTTFNSIINMKLTIGKTLLVGFLIFLFCLPILSAMWFAPLLIFIHQKTCLEAIKISVDASLKNIIPAVIFNVFILILFCLSLITCGLGFLILIPVLFGAIYASYKDIFFGV